MGWQIKQAGPLWWYQEGLRRGKLAEMELANVNYTVVSLVVKHNDSTEILSIVAFK